MILLPVPTTREHLERSARHWLPFVESIAERAREPVTVLIDDVMSGRVQVHLVWNEDAKEAKALAGVRIVMRGSDRIAELIWCTGEGMADWADLVSDIERYCKEHLNCAGIKAICRPGWKKTLAPKGYRLTHLVMEKDF